MKCCSRILSPTRESTEVLEIFWRRASTLDMGAVRCLCRDGRTSNSEFEENHSATTSAIYAGPGITGQGAA
jgi:hypothetical protein